MTLSLSDQQLLKDVERSFAAALVDAMPTSLRLPLLEAHLTPFDDVVISVRAPHLPLEVICELLIALPRTELLANAGVDNVCVTFEVLESARPKPTRAEGDEHGRY